MAILETFARQSAYLAVNRVIMATAVTHALQSTSADKTVINASVTQTNAL